MTTPLENTVTDDVTSFDYGKTEQEVRAARNAEAAGVSQTLPVRLNFWSNDEILRHYFPGQDDLPEEHKQYIEFKKMNEGMRQKYQKLTQSNAIIERATNNTRIGIDQARDRMALIETSVTGWRLFQGDRELKFSGSQLNIFVKQADPAIIDGLEKAIRKANPWLITDVKSEDLREQIAELEEQYKEALKREEEEKNS